MRPLRTIAALACLGLALVGCGDDPAEEASTEIEGVEVFEGLSTTHTEEAVQYETEPPVGGEHHPVWLNCGVYTEPVPDEHAVHALEHGVVWLVHDPELPDDQVDELLTLHDARPDRIIVSPYPGMDAPVGALAWERRLLVDSADDPRIEQFVEAFVNGAAAPEPAAACTGGVGNPR